MACRLPARLQRAGLRPGGAADVGSRRTQGASGKNKNRTKRDGSGQTDNYVTQPQFAETGHELDRQVECHILHVDGTYNVLANYTYTYDNANRVTDFNRTGTSTTYGYDATNQLTNEDATAFSYDATGNRTMTGYTTGTGNRMSNDGVFTYTYDSEGNITKKSKGATQETWTFAYDNDNHLVGVEKRTQDGGGTLQMRATYVYDGLRNRIEKQVYDGVSTTTTRFTYDGSEVWADLDGSSSLTTRYVCDEDMQHIARVASGSTFWFLADRLGSVRNEVDSDGTLSASIVYDAVGKVTSESGTPGNYRYAGYYSDGESGLYVTLARYYDPLTSRWISEDPMGFGAGDANLFRYVGNNATNEIDPSGLKKGGHRRPRPQPKKRKPKRPAPQPQPPQPPPQPQPQPPPQPVRRPRPPRRVVPPPAPVPVPPQQAVTGPAAAPGMTLGQLPAQQQQVAVVVAAQRAAPEDQASGNQGQVAAAGMSVAGQQQLAGMPGQPQQPVAPPQPQVAQGPGAPQQVAQVNQGVAKVDPALFLVHGVRDEGKWYDKFGENLNAAWKTKQRSSHFTIRDLCGLSLTLLDLTQKRKRRSLRQRRAYMIKAC